MGLFSLIPASLNPDPEVANYLSYEFAQTNQIILLKSQIDRAQTTNRVLVSGGAATPEAKEFLENTLKTDRKLADKLRYHAHAHLDSQLVPEIKVFPLNVLEKAWKQVYPEALIPIIHSHFSSLLSPEEAHSHSVILVGIIPNTTKLRFIVSSARGKAFVKNFMMKPDRRKQVAVVAKLQEKQHLLTHETETVDEKTMLELLRRYYPLTQPGLDTAASAELARGMIEEFRERTVSSENFSTQPLDESKTQQAFREIVVRGYKSGAHDIHISYLPSKKLLEYSYLLDGIRIVGTPIPIQFDSIFKQLVTLIQDKCKMPTITEKQKPQYGFARINVNEREHFTIRAVKLPRLDVQQREGETSVIILRIHRSHEKVLKLNELGIMDRFEPYLNHISRLTKGMVTFVGPMGSGKSMFAASMLKRLMEIHPDWPVMSLERPVEFEIPGAYQIEVGHGASPQDFLRVFMQSACKIFFPSEINDPTTADATIQLAHTGHLVLTTLHCDSPFQVPLRFLGFGIEPDHYAESLELAIGQRLVRRNCPTCSVPEDFQKRFKQDRLFAHSWTNLSKMCEFWGIPLQDIEFRRGTGQVNGTACKTCEYAGISKGVKGRTGVFEFWQTQPYQDALRTREGIEAVRRELLTPKTDENGNLSYHWTLFRNAIELSRLGIVSLDSITESLGILNPSAEGHPDFQRQSRQQFRDENDFLENWYRTQDRINSLEQKYWNLQNPGERGTVGSPDSQHSSASPPIIDGDLIDTLDIDQPQ